MKSPKADCPRILLDWTGNNMAAESNLHVLLVDENPDDVDLLRRQLESEFPGIEIDQASAPEPLERALEAGRFNLVITDFQLQWSDGLAVLRAVKFRFPYRPVIMFTATGTPEVAVEALKSGLDDYIIKTPRHYVRLLASVRTVLQRTEVERRDADLQVRLEHLLSRIDAGVFRAERGGRLLECNTAFLRLLHADSLESAREIFARDFGPVIEAVAGPAIGDHAPVRREIRQSGPRGEQWFLIEEVITTNIAGQVFVDGLIEEITERKLLERESRQRLSHEQAARQEAEEGSRLKDEFLAVISHDLRTPLTSILGWSVLLRTGQLTGERAQAALATIERNAQAQKRLIDDLQDVSGIVTGTVRLDIRDIDPIPPVDAAIAAQRPVAEAKRVHLRTSMETNAAHIRVDSDRLQQIVSNLVDNSIKFTEADGDVEVGLKSEGTHLKITIRDSGIGIKRDFLPFVFDRFRQADPKITRSRAGRGLGLAIVRQLVERMGGEVHADSDGEGKGATFVVRFPLRGMNDGNITVCREKETAPHPTLLDGLRILVVDDNPDTCFMLKTMIEDCGATAITVTSAAEAMEAIGHEDFDLLVSDIAMPNVDGYTLIESVRGLPSRAGRIRAIALTAYGRDEDRAKALRAGYQTFIVKPVAYDELMAVIADLV